MNEEVSLYHKKNKGARMNIKVSTVTNPIFYLTLACYVGEATLSMIGISIHVTASAMYLLVFVALLLTFRKRIIIKVQAFDIVSLFYLYIVVRNITANLETMEAYLMPNLITWLMLVLLCKCYLCDDQYGLFLKITYVFVSVLMIIGVGKVILVGGRLAVFGGPNGFYKFAMLFQTLSFSKYVFEKKRIHVVGIISGLILAIMTGSKGAIISIIIIVPLEYLLYILQNKKLNEIPKKIVQLGLVTVAGLLLYYNFADSIPGFSTAFNRGVAILHSNQNELTSVAARYRLLNMSVDYFIQSPVFGKGARYMYYDTLNSYSPQPYAHNVFFEMLGEQGLIGFSLFLFILFIMVMNLKKIGIRNIYSMSFSLGFIVYFIGAQFSGNILDTKMAIFFAEMIIVLGSRKNLSKMTVLEDNTTSTIGVF
ncbi:O-antigen ligase family protein [Roseburia hominis]